MVCKNYNLKSAACKNCTTPKERYITFTRDNIVKIRAGDKTETRRVIEKVDHYKNLHRCDKLLVRKNRFSKKVIAKLVVIATWTENLKEITNNGIIAEGFLQKFIDYKVMAALKAKFIAAWNKINGARGYAWHTNPKVRVIYFVYVGD